MGSGGGGEWEGLGGDLEAVEEEAGAVDVDPVGGEELDDMSDGDVQLLQILWGGKVEATAGAAFVGVGRGVAVGVVVVAEGLAAQRGGAAGVAVGEEMCAEGCGHGVGASPRVLFGLGSSCDEA